MSQVHGSSFKEVVIQSNLGKEEDGPINFVGAYFRSYHISDGAELEWPKA